MYYRDLTRPHLWPTPTLLEALHECEECINYSRTNPDLRADLRQLRLTINTVLDKRRVPARARQHR